MSNQEAQDPLLIFFILDGHLKSRKKERGLACLSRRHPNSKILKSSNLHILTVLVFPLLSGRGHIKQHDRPDHQRD